MIPPEIKAANANKIGQFMKAIPALAAQPLDHFIRGGYGQWNHQ